MAALVWFLPMDVFRWFKRWVFFEKDFIYMVSPQSVLCTVRLIFPENFLLQWLHWYDFSPVCVLWCFVISLDCKKTVTMAGLKWSPPSVKPHLVYNNTIKWKFLITMTALIYFPFVYPHMGYKVASFWEFIVTLVTLI